jgi:DNA-binding MarR family transcriptional regulator
MAKTSADLARSAVDLRMAVGRIGRRLRQLYATPDAETDPGFLEVAVLTRLDRLGPLTSRALAEIESVTPQAIGTALSTLHQRGFVVRAQDPNDGRKVISTITDRGRRTLAGREHAVNEQMRRTLTDAFDATERAQIAAVIPLLERFADHLSYTPQQQSSWDGDAMSSATSASVRRSGSGAT